METKTVHKVASIKDRYLTFFLENEKYGVEILSVKEIIGLQKTIHVPRTPHYVKGVMNLRGQIIPVIDLRAKLDMEEIPAAMDTAIVIVQIGKLNIGFVVDRVDEVASIAESDLSEPPRFGSSVNTEFIKNMANTRGSVVMIIDLEKIFGVDELEHMSAMTQTQQNQQEERAA